MDRSDFEIEESVFWDIRNYFDKGIFVEFFFTKQGKTANRSNEIYK